MTFGLFFGSILFSVDGTESILYIIDVSKLIMTVAMVFASYLQA